MYYLHTRHRLVNVWTQSAVALKLSARDQLWYSNVLAIRHWEFDQVTLKKAAGIFGY